MYCKAGNSGSG